MKKMQTEVPTLPVVHSNVHESFVRKESGDVQNLSAQDKSSLLCKSTIQLSSNRKYLQPLLEEAYHNGKKLNSYPNKKKATSTIGQRVTSAKMLHIKQLQNQLADAHYHLNELATENRLLKALQKKQESALRRYEGTNAELPRIISSHQEELRVLQTRYKKLKNMHQETCDLLKEKESELHALQVQNKHLIQLSKDRNLKEREQLQAQVMDLNQRIQQHQDTIESLHKKTILESKSLKQQLQSEVNKHKETQKSLQDAVKKLKTLENLLDYRERRIYYNGHIPTTNIQKNVSSQSLTNLRGISTPSTFEKPLIGKQKVQSGIQKNSLPILSTLPSNEEESRKVDSEKNLNQLVGLKTETMTTLQQVRKFKLQRSINNQNSSPLNEVLQRNTDKCEIESKIHQNARRFSFGYKSDSVEDVPDYQKDLNRYEKYEQLMNPQESIVKEKRSMYKLPNELKLQYGYTSSNTDSEDENSKSVKEGSVELKNCTQNSQRLHARLINSPDGHSDRMKSFMKNELQLSDAKNDLGEYPVQKVDHSVPKHENEFSSSKQCQDPSEKVLEWKFTDNSKTSDSVATDKNTLPTSDLNNSIPDDHLQVTAKFQNNPEFLKLLTRANSQYEKLKNLEQKEEVQNEAQTKQSREQGRENSNSTVNTVFFDEQCYSMNNESSVAVDETRNSLENKRPMSNLYVEEAKSTYSDFQHENLINSEIFSKDLIQDGSTIKSNVTDGSQNQHNNSLLLGTDGKSISYKNNVINGEVIQKKDINKSLITKVTYNKDELLATMKAIDDNENIEFFEDQGFQKNEPSRRMQITENLFRGLPTHTKRKHDVMKDIFADDTIENKLRSNCSKLH